MVKLPFRRDKDSSDTAPKEVKDYYQAEKREKVGVAGLLALGTLLVTVVLAMGLFFGSRWVYRTVFDDSKDSDQQTAQQDDQNQEVDAAASAEQSEVENEFGPDTTSSDEDESLAAASGTANQQQRDDLPSAGPTDTLIILISTVLFGSAGYYVYGGKKATK